MEKDTSTHKEIILLGKWNPESLESLMRGSSKINDASLRIDSLSMHFLDTPYQESTLIGDYNTPEVFVINLGGVDCYTLIDYVEAMRLSASFHEFKENVRKVRYKGGKIGFIDRNHFFTDWSRYNADLIDDVTEQIGGNRTIEVEKTLNMKEDKTYFIPGIQPKERLIKYIPVNAIDDSIINELRTGDYIGMYSEKQGLDISHAGIIIKKGRKIYLRHASSIEVHRRVIDEDFKTYILSKPGIIIFRPKERFLTGSALQT